MVEKLPPIPPNCDRFVVVDGHPYWIAPHPDSKRCGKVSIQLDDQESLQDASEWLGVVASDAEVACLKLCDGTESDDDEAFWGKWWDASLDWREWGESKPANETDDKEELECEQPTS